MKRVRVIPLLMIDDGRAVITRNFKTPVYVGDPLNAIRIFNDKEVDELFIVDITRNAKTSRPDFELIAMMASESFMPLAYGGHVRRIEDAEKIINCGIEKLSFNTALFSDPVMVKELSYRYGRQSIIASVDYKKNWLGKPVIRTDHNSRTVGGNFPQNIERILSLGVGEILLNSIDRDGCFSGYDLEMIRTVSALVNIPVVACGGAASVDDFKNAVSNGASAAAAGAMFYFKGSIDAVLINYPDQQVLTTRLYDLLD
jgi:imidazole glycerol-phosphate synthase subunit HisF